MPPADHRPTRKNIRLKDYDYAQPGVYYVTICTAEKHCFFGDIRDGCLMPSIWGKAAERWWKDIPRRWPPVELDQWILMPNHLHGVLIFPDTGDPLPTLGDVVNWYKGTVTRAIRRLDGGAEAVVWQRGYYDHIVRYEKRLERIRVYIARNPGRWEEDKYYTAAR
jgi:putative transposase